MMTLEILANLAEILAGLAIVGAAIRAWPIFRGMEDRLSDQRRASNLVTADIERLRQGLEEIFGVTAPSVEPREILELLLRVLPAHGGTDVYFEHFKKREPLPGVLGVRMYRQGQSSLKQEICTFSDEGYRVIITALEHLAGSNAVQNEHAYVDLGEHRFLLSLATSVSGPVASLRLIPGEVFGIEALRLDKEPWWPDLKDLLSGSTPGALLCAGPTGSGKSTTMASLIEYAARDENARIVSMELPVEFIHERITQLTCERENELDQLYRSAQAQFPDVLMIGCRGSGKYIWNSYGQCCVFAPITANDAVSALEQVNREGRSELKSLDWPFVILGQLLLQRLCRECAQPVDLTAEDEAIIEAIKDYHGNCLEGLRFSEKWAEAGGCDHCIDGYAGRIALVEKLNVDESLMQKVSTSNRDLRQHAIEAGMASFQLRALSYASAGFITFSDLKRVSAEHEYPHNWSGSTENYKKELST